MSEALIARWSRLDRQYRRCIADLLEALKATQFGFNLRRCPVCAGFNKSSAGETDMVHRADCIVAKAIKRAEQIQ